MVDRHGRACVVDFGLAQEHHGTVELSEDSFGTPARPLGDENEPNLSMPGAVVGTPAYMSPEQHQGAATSTSTDQYSFSVVAFEALYGVRPYVGNSRLLIHYAIRRGELSKPNVDIHVPPEIHEVVMRGLAVEPSQRWASMEDLLEALRAAAGVRIPRARWQIALAAIALVVIGVLATLLLRTPAPPSPAALSRVDELTQSAIAAGANARWVYPDRERVRDTALVWLHELSTIEADDGAAAEVAGGRVATLREDFSDALTRLGDHYWAREGGRVFARDFYLQAALFGADSGHARERCGYSNGELADLRARALAGTLTLAEVDAGRDLAELAAAVVRQPSADPESIAHASDDALIAVSRRRWASRSSGPRVGEANQQRFTSAGMAWSMNIACSSAALSTAVRPGPR